MRLPPPRYEHCLVTGASSGIGRAFARALAPRAARLTLTARRAERLEALAAELRAARPGLECRVAPLDLGAEDGPARLLAAVEAEGVAVDLLVNDAGYGLHAGWSDCAWDEWRRMIQLNVVSSAALLRLFWDQLVAVPGRGAISLSSVAGFQPIPWFSCYSATKAFVRSLSQGIGAEARARGARFLSLCPGPTRSEFADVAHAEWEWGNLLMAPEDVVAAALKAYEKGKPEVIAGWFNKLQCVAATRLPLRFVVAMSEKAGRRKSAFRREE